jgi:hypothetical protein
MIDLTIVWALLLAFIVGMYVVMDGFDLGIGILFPRFPVGKERDQAMNSIAPVWDGNETWLILGGNGLLAAFPVAYAIILPALYAPLIAMLLGLSSAASPSSSAGATRGTGAGGTPASSWARSLPPLRRGDARRPASGHHDHGPRLRRRVVGMVLALHHAGRCKPGRRLCAARRLLAGLEDEGELHRKARHLSRLLLRRFWRRLAR